MTFCLLGSALPPALPGAVAGSARVHVQADRARANGVVYRHAVPALRVSTGWTGRVSGCRPGTISTSARRASLDLVNSVRGLAGLRPVTFSSYLSGKAQRTALMMEAARKLSHQPGPSWPCWTRAGASAAGRSNLAYLSSGRLSLPAYLSEPGSMNRAVGHRRWLLDPRQTRFGIGQTRHANALYVLDTGTWSWPAGAAPLNAWPTAGYFPVALEPRGRWSLSSARPAYDFRRARVSVTGPSGPLSLSTYRERSVISWDLARAISRSAARDRAYTVTVSGIRRSGALLSPVRYRVVLVPLRRVLTTRTPTVNGTSSARVAAGSRLAAAPGSWTPSRVRRYSYQWLRDGQVISGATSSAYVASTGDAGHRISVRVRAVPASSWYRTGSASSTDGSPQAR